MSNDDKRKVSDFPMLHATLNLLMDEGEAEIVIQECIDSGANMADSSSPHLTGMVVFQDTPQGADWWWERTAEVQAILDKISP